MTAPKSRTVLGRPRYGQAGSVRKRRQAPQELARSRGEPLDRWRLRAGLPRPRRPPGEHPRALRLPVAAAPGRAMDVSHRRRGESRRRPLPAHPGRHGHPPVTRAHRRRGPAAGRPPGQGSARRAQSRPTLRQRPTQGGSRLIRRPAGRRPPARRRARPAPAARQAGVPVAPAVGGAVGRRGRTRRYRQDLRQGRDARGSARR